MIRSRSKLAAAVKAEGNWVTKSVYRGPAAVHQLMIMCAHPSSLALIGTCHEHSRPSSKHMPEMLRRGTPPELEGHGPQTAVVRLTC